MRVIVIKAGAVGIGKADFDSRVLFLEETANAGNRASRTNGADEAINAAIRLLPDFRAGAAVMALHVGGVVKLVGPDHPPVMGRCQLGRE